MNLLRSLLHMLFMVVTVIPWALAVLVAAPFLSSTQIYWMCVGWLRLAVRSGELILGIRNRVTGYENLPVGSTDPAILLVKHQSTWETFCMPTLMPHPLAYVFKKELLYVPFFGWAMARMDMIHIDRSKRRSVSTRWSSRGSVCWTRAPG
jgi:1-acyl-sn-glycerol-3-phosphate acyltransferase